MPIISTPDTPKKSFHSGYANTATQTKAIKAKNFAKKAPNKKESAPKTSEPPKEKLPAFSPREQNWDDLPSRVSSANMYALLSGQGNKSLDDLARDMSVPILAFTGTLLQEIRHITKSLPNSEHAVFLALRRIDENRPHFLAYDFFMPEQTASGGGVSLDPKDCQRHFDSLKGHPWYRKNGTHRHLCHLHSHAGMGVFWSGVDNTQQLSRDDLGFMDDFRFYCVVNTKDEIKCSLVIYKPALTRIDAVVAVSYAGDGHAEQLTKKRKAELDRIVSTVMSQPKPSQWSFEASEFEEEKRDVQASVPEKWNYPGLACPVPADATSKATGWNQKAYDDSIHRYADSLWEEGWGEYSGSDIPVKERKLRLDLIPIPDGAKRSPNVPAKLIQSFMENSNADEKMAGQVVRLLGVLIAETGVSLEYVDKRTGEIMDEGVSPEAVGEVFAEYLCEFSDIVVNPSFYESEMPNLVSADTIKAYVRKDKIALFAGIVNDLVDLIVFCE